MTPIEIIISNVIAIIIGCGLGYLTSYFTERGKNKALLVDVEKIQEIVKNIDSKFEYTTQSKISLKIEERNALVNHYEKYYFWLNSIYDFSFNNINEENLLKLKVIEQKIDEARFQSELAFARMELFVNNEEIIKLSSELSSLTKVFHLILWDHFSSLENVLLKIKKYNAEMLPINVYEAYQTLLSEKDEIIADYGSDSIKLHAKIKPLNETFQKLIQIHLQALLK